MTGDGVKELLDFLNDIDNNFRVVVNVKEEDVENLLANLKGAGYQAMVQSSPFSKFEVVISDGDSGPAQYETS